MEKELTIWLRHSYREGLKSYNAQIRENYSSEAIVIGKKTSPLGKISPRRRGLWAALMAMF